jgi:hypothetical protein
MIPIESYLPDPLIETLIDTLPTVYTLSALQSLVRDGEIDHETARTLLAPFTAENPCVGNRSHELAQILIDLHHDFDEIRERKRDEAKAKRALRTESSKAPTENDSDGGEDSSEEEPAETQPSGLMLRIDLRYVHNINLDLMLTDDVRKIGIFRAQTVIQRQ